MADAIISFGVQKLGDFLISKTVLRRRMREDLKWLRSELGYMHSFLKDAEQKQGSDHLVQEWVFEVTNLVYDILDILDDFNIKEGNNIVAAADLIKHGIADPIKKLARCLCKEVLLCNICSEIESLKERVLDLSRKRDTYGITSINDSNARESRASCDTESSSIGLLRRSLRRASSFAEQEKYFIGFDDDSEKLMDELLKQEPCRCVLSIYGMGGIGKTTLVRKIYNSKEIQGRFTYRAWVCVSQEYSMQDLLLTIINSFRKGCPVEEFEMLKKMNEDYLERHIRKFLKGKTYLIVVDDVWHKEAWEGLRKAFPDCYTGSRVIITTRKKDVAERVVDDSNYAHHLRFLRPEESWDLFKMKISHGDHINEVPERFSTVMQDLGREMVDKCGGLPLAIVVLGGLLSGKNGLEEWRRVKKNLWQHIKNDSIDISHILFLSYNDLSGELRQCFLYLGIFPEDYSICVKKLIWFWMAEGFIPEGNQMEDVAEEYLNELINRSLIQVSEITDGRINELRVHDLLRDLAIEKAMGVHLFDIFDPREHSAVLLDGLRRHVIHTDIKRYFSISPSAVRLRSLLSFNAYPGEVLEIGTFMTKLQKLGYLRVLELVNIKFTTPLRLKPLGNLVHLKFLGLIYVDVDQLPASIGNLRNLQTLYILVAANLHITLPVQISKLKDLRHIVVDGIRGILKFDSLTNLRTLKEIDFDMWNKADTTKLCNLRELVLRIKRNKKPEEVNNSYPMHSFRGMKSLDSLSLINKDHSTVLPPIDPICNSCPSLTRLHLRGRISELRLPESISVLILAFSELPEDPMPTLGRLNHLKSLEMYKAYAGKVMMCNANGFPQLEYLCLSDLKYLERIDVLEGAMPVIKGLRIHRCRSLKVVPMCLISIALPSESLKWHYTT